MQNELKHLDILDASFPCSSFSTSGNREKDWGKKKKFREGQKEQTLDDLAFYSIEVAKVLQPKVVICENVKGIILGKAQKYTREIIEGFDEAGYICQLFLLKGENMGVPQKRPRVFFLSLRKDLAAHFLVTRDLFTQVPYINMEFNEKPILYGEFEDNTDAPPIPNGIKAIWEGRRVGDTLLCDSYVRKYRKRRYFDYCFAYRDKVCPTLTAHKESGLSFYEPRYFSRSELIHASTFPEDFDFGKEAPHYVCGMAVPPVMMAQVSSRVYEYWLSKIK